MRKWKRGGATSFHTAESLEELPSLPPLKVMVCSAVHRQENWLDQVFAEL